MYSDTNQYQYDDVRYKLIAHDTARFYKRKSNQALFMFIRGKDNFIHSRPAALLHVLVYNNKPNMDLKH